MLDKTKPIDLLMEKEMSRKEFIGMTALGLGSVLGFSTIIKLFTGKSLEGHISKHVDTGNSLDYGGGLYGGVSK